MGRPGFLMVGAVLAGLVAAIAALASAPEPAPPTAVIPDDPPPVVAADDFGRCRTITEPDAACAAAWDAKRRRFFGEKD
jgi:conjugative transfer region protein TrbK